MSENSKTLLGRRRVLMSFGTVGIGAIAGCSGNDNGDTSTTRGEDNKDIEDENNKSINNGDNSNNSESNNTGETDGENNGDSEYTLTFEHPDSVLPDQAFEMVVNGLPADETIEIRVGDPGRVRSATAKIHTDNNEEFNVSKASIIGGDVPQDIDVPLPVVLNQFVGITYRNSQTSGSRTVRYGIAVDNEEIGSTTVRRQHPNLGSATKINNSNIVGELFESTEDGSRPGVITLHGAGANQLRYRSGLLAQHGFTTLALQYFGAPELPNELAEIPLEYVESAIEWLLDHPSVEGDQIELLGFSKGAELALQVGSRFESVGSVVSISGSGVTWQAVRGDEMTSSWTLNGEPVPYISYGEREASLRESYIKSFEEAGEKEIEEAIIPVENIDGPVLFISGIEDEVWDAVRFQRVAEQRLSSHDRSNFKHLIYEDAGHVITPPYLPLHVGTAGTSKGNAEASHDHWPHIRDTLSRVTESN